MKPHRSAVLVATLAAVVLVGAPRAQTTTYDLTAEWSDVTSRGGTWSYERTPGTAFAKHLADWGPGSFLGPQPAWANAQIGTFGHVPALMRLAFLPLGSGNDVQVGDVVAHSDDTASGTGSENPCVTWTCPTAANATVAGAIWITRDIGRSVDWMLVHNKAIVQQGVVFSGDPYGRANPAVIAATRPVVRGDVLRLVLKTSATSPFGDLVGLALKVTLDRVTGRFVGYGTSCGPSLAAYDVPTLGQTFSVEHFGRAATAVALLLGTAPSAVPLAVIGMPGCTLYDTANVVLPGTTDAAGRASFPLAVPAALALLGQSVYAQDAELAPGANAIGVLATAGGQAVIGQ